MKREYINKIEQLTRFLSLVERTAANLTWKAVPADMKEKALDMIDKVVADAAKHKGSIDALIDKYAGDLKQKSPEAVAFVKHKLKSAIEQAIEEIKKAA